MPNKAISLTDLRNTNATKRKAFNARESSSSRGYDAKWRKARRYHLIHNPLCVACKADELVVQATVVDHRIPHKGDQVIFWDRSNWQSLCTEHHNIKTATEDGGFGRPTGNGRFKIKE